MSVKKIAIMVDEMYQVLEVWYPYYRLREANATGYFGESLRPGKERWR